MANGANLKRSRSEQIMVRVVNDSVIRTVIELSQGGVKERIRQLNSVDDNVTPVRALLDYYEV